MDILQFIIQLLAVVLAGLALMLGIPLFMRFRWPAATMWMLKLFASALSPVFVLIGILTTVVGLATGSTVISLIGLLVVLIYSFHLFSITRQPNLSTGFEEAFGSDWRSRIPRNQKKHFLKTRMALRLPVVPKPRLQQNIPFATIPGTDRQLLCDIWQPPEGVQPTGVAFIYLHGSAFYILDKDCGTRPFFSHLAAQGHVIMDVAYRLAPETDIMGMVQDAKRAIIWMKEHASEYDVDAERIVLGGGSAGGHLALLTAYTSDIAEFALPVLEEKDASVCAVISLYSTCDLEALYYHTNQHLTTRSTAGMPKKKVPTKMPGWIVKAMGNDYHRLGFDKGFEKVGNLPLLLGGHPDEYPERYALFSPVTHVHAHCPPTLLIHGEHDIMAPIRAILTLHNRLLQNDIPVVLHIFPQTDHGFDLVLPKISPAAHNAIYDVERFIGLMSMGKSISHKGEKNLKSSKVELSTTAT